MSLSSLTDSSVDTASDSEKSFFPDSRKEKNLIFQSRIVELKGSLLLLPGAQTLCYVSSTEEGGPCSHHCSCGTVHISRGAPPTDSVLEPELDTPQSTSKRWLAFAGVSFSRCFADISKLAVLALARIMCANIHSQNGTAILAQVLLITQVRKIWKPTTLTRDGGS